MGSKFVEGRSVEFSKSYEESSPSTPIFFILSPGVDPLKDVEALGKCGEQKAASRVQSREREPSAPSSREVPDTQQGPLPGSCALLVGPREGGKTAGGKVVPPKSHGEPLDGPAHPLPLKHTLHRDRLAAARNPQVHQLMNG